MTMYELPEYTSKRDDFRVLTCADELKWAIEEGGNIVAIDTETYYDERNKGVVRFIYGSPNNVPFCMTATVKVGDEYITYYVSEEQIEDCKPWLEDDKLTKILHNAN